MRMHGRIFLETALAQELWNMKRFKNKCDLNSRIEMAFLKKRVVYYLVSLVESMGGHSLPPEK